jgi:hypothetical protein
MASTPAKHIELLKQTKISSKNETVLRQKGRKYAFTLKYDEAPTLSVLYCRVNLICYFYTRVSFLLSFFSNIKRQQMDDSKNEYANQLQKTNELQVCIHKINTSSTAAIRMVVTVMQYTVQLCPYLS